MVVQTETYISEALRIVEKAEEQGILLRLLGSIAFRLHCPKWVHLLDEMERELTDIDYMGSSQHLSGYKPFMSEMGYVSDGEIEVLFEGRRFFFTNEKKKGLGIDIFIDNLEYCHKIKMKDRLALDKPTIPLVELLMEKMQIVEINPKDVKDTLVLILEHDLGTDDSDPNKLNMTYLCKVLAKDWGFHKTCTTNLEKCKRYLQEFDALSGDNKTELTSKFDHILSAIEAEPKTLTWKMRAKVGTRIQWYNPVAAKETAFSGVDRRNHTGEKESE